MSTQPPIDRREMIARLAKWSAGALAAAGLGGSATACLGTRHASAPRYSDYSDYANYFDYSDYANYGNYVNYADSAYGDYADYANYANYGDYFDYQDAYADGYSDYANYADYSDYGDYSDYEDYSDYTDGAAAAGGAPRRPAPRGGYADYADAYADAGALAAPGRVRAVRRPFHGTPEPPPRGGALGARAAGWVELPAERVRAGGTGAAEPALRGAASQGPPGELQRPERQRAGRRSRLIAGPSNRKARP